MSHPALQTARALCASAAVAAGVLLAAFAPAEAAADTVLHATAGIAGLVKAGRWTPIQVVIEHSGPDLDAEVVVAWGGVTARRQVALASPARRQIELYLRTPNVEGTVRVHLVANAETIAGHDIPGHPLRQDEPLTLCIAQPGGAEEEPGACSATLTPAELPRSPRGYEAVDRIISPAGDPALGAEQRTALAQWQALKRLDDSGDLSLTPRAARPTVPLGLPADTARVVATIAAAYAGGLLLAGLWPWTALRGVGAIYLTMAAIIATGSAAAFAIGRAGPAGAVRVHHASLLQQIPGTPGSWLTVRGVAEFPAFDAFGLRWRVPDAVLELATGSDRAEQRADAEGYPLIAGVFGLGRRLAFSGEAVAEIQPLAVAWQGRTTRVSNQSVFDLQDCRFADGFSPTAVGSLRPGASAVGEQVTDVAGPIFTCAIPGAAVGFVEEHHAVDSAGMTTVAVYRDPRNPPWAAPGGGQ